MYVPYQGVLNSLTTYTHSLYADTTDRFDVIFTEKVINYREKSCPLIDPNI